MKTKFAAAVAFASMGAFSAPSFAGDAAAANATKTYRLKDGGTLYVFKDGKMAQENQYGRAIYLNKGQVYEASDGQKITANSNEVARLANLLRKGHED